MSKNELDKILEKVRKLLALASNNPNEYEATSATEMAKRILDEYNLSLTDVEVNDIVEKAVVFNTVRLDTWKGLLAVMVSNVFDCFVYQSTTRENKETRIVFVGTKADSEVATYVYLYLGRVITSLINKKVKENNSSVHGNELRRAYSLGILSTLRKRLTDFYGKEREINDTIVGVSGKTGKELMVIKQNAIDKWKAEQDRFGEKKLYSNKGCNANLYHDGMKDGNDIALTHVIKYNPTAVSGYIN